MFAGLVLVMLIGFPVAFSLAALRPGLRLSSASSWASSRRSSCADLPLRVFGILSNELLLAIPFFTFMGAILERCGLAEDLLEGTGQLFGARAAAGSAYAVIIVGAILGAITGTVAAIGDRDGRDLAADHDALRLQHALATGVIAASGTITQLIPPSLVLVVLADQLGRSVGDMYKGAIGPSIAAGRDLPALHFVLIRCLRPHWCRRCRRRRARSAAGRCGASVLWGMVPSIVLIFLVLGTIFMGLATPTEAGAMGAVGAMVLAALHRRLTWPLVRQGMDSTMRITAMVIFILIGSTVFSLVFQGVDGDVWIEHMLPALPGGQIGFLIVVNIFVFFLAFFLDFFEIAFIIMPLLAPVADKLGIDLIWFGVLLCVNMQTSFMHPPFGFALFYLRGIADQVFKNGDRSGRSCRRTSTSARSRGW